MREVTMELRRLIEAYRWQRGLGHDIIATPYGRIVTNLAHPTVWDANHADAVTAEQPEEIAALLASMDDHLAHTPWRVVHTDPFTPEAFRSEEHTSELQSLMRISYAVFCLKKKKEPRAIIHTKCIVDN